MSDQQTQTAQVTAEPPAGEWAMVEIFGHRQHYGFLTEVERFGSKLARIDEYLPGAGAPMRTHFYGGSAIFSITPTTEELCRKMVERYVPPPAVRSLPAPDDDDGDYEEPF